MKVFSLLLAITCLFTSLNGQSDFEDYINNWRTQKTTKHANVGVSVRAVDGNELLSHYNHDYSLIPASSLKLITTLIALEKLGSETNYETYLAHDGQIDPDGTLQGNLYIIGSGDPTLGSARIPGTSPRNDLLLEIVDMVKQKGITCIDGKVVADESVFDAYPIAPSWQWNDLGNYYAGGAWGLNINENEYGIYFNSNRRIGSLSKLLFTDFKIPGLKLTNEVTVDSANTGDNAYVFGGPYDFEKRIVGTIPQSKKNFRIKGAMPDPPKYIAYAIREKLAKKGIKSNGTYVKVKKWSKKYKHTTVFDTIISPPISEIAKYANYFSINQYCESLLKTLGLQINGKASGGQGILAIFKTLNAYKIDTEGLHMEDGSGLSARNLVSPDILAEFLAKYTNKNGLKLVQKMLPKAGADGTVRGMLSGRQSRGNVWLKSGSMERILSYTGLCKAKSGKWITFSIIINGYTGKYKNFRPQVELLIDQIYKQH